MSGPGWRIHRHLRTLKDLRRTGWVQRGVTDPESVAAHSHALAVLCVLEAGRRGLDPARAALLAVIHDLPEALVGDRVPGELSPQVKHQLEAEAIRSLDAEAGGGGRLVAAWEEYESGASGEARLVRALDLAEATLQGAAYDAQGRVAPGATAELVGNCLGRIVDDELRASLTAELARPPQP